MIAQTTLRVAPREAADPESLRLRAAHGLDIPPGNINDLKIVRRSIDARQRNVMVNLTVAVATGDDREVKADACPIEFQQTGAGDLAVIIVGAGPAGLFAALRALELGIRPIVVERGKDVDSRRRDITSLCRSGVVDAESNYCFGEGGAGTFSDGKLFTRSKKRGNVSEVLQILHQHGADGNICIESHPHIGSDRLPGVIRNIRQTILDHGGEVFFNTRMEKLLTENGTVCGIVTADGRTFHGPVILATGHSARDVYHTLHDSGIRLEPKGFAMGVRLEHPQALIDRIQYHSPQGRGQYLPAAEYNFVCQADDRGVYSFCMCPGGVIVPAASSPGESVVNGMSASARASRWANSGMVVEIRPGDFPEYEHFGPLSLLEFQADVERKFFKTSGETLNAPAQRMKDFTEGKLSATLPPTSYVCGIHPERLDLLLPKAVATRLQKGFIEFGRKSKGFLTNEACLIGLESRTSSPVRIPRHPDSLNHPDFPGLYPAGEGAGYAGGIVSAAMDGRRCMDAVAQTLRH